jgi:hypothetical protein
VLALSDESANLRYADQRSAGSEVIVKLHATNGLSFKTNPLAGEPISDDPAARMVSAEHAV